MTNVWSWFTVLAVVYVSHVRCKERKSGVGYFWQITDIHVDWKYSEVGDVSKMCHGSVPFMFRNGLYGNYSCDSPMKLAESAVSFMAKELPNPDFILWTGDNIPHVSDPEPEWDVVYDTLTAIVETMQTYFPGVPILPVLGNHDTYPKNAFPAKGGNSFYSHYLNNGSWDRLIPASGHKSFLRGGYYATNTPSGLRVLGLNTNLYYKWNPNVTNLKDPAGQLAFMEKELKSARKKKQKVILMAHIPPGYFERHAEEGMFSESHTKYYLDVVLRYSDVIVAQFYGHLHTDSYRLISKDHDEHMVAFASPSVTPWNATVPGGTAVNPSVRKYSYNKDTFDVVDYWQYYFNLTKANQEAEITREKNAMGETEEANITTEKDEANVTREKDEANTTREKDEANTTREKDEANTTREKNEANTTREKDEANVAREKDGTNVTREKDRANVTREKDGANTRENDEANATEVNDTKAALKDNSHRFWEVLYQATKAYQIKDVGGNSMFHLYSKLIDKDHHELFDLYYAHNSVGIPHAPCTGECKAEQLCAIGHFFDYDLKKCKHILLISMGFFDKKESETHVREKVKEDVGNVEGGLATTQASSKHEYISSASPWYVVGLGIGILIVLVMGILLWLSKKKMTKMSATKWKLRKDDREYLLL